MTQAQLKERILRDRGLGYQRIGNTIRISDGTEVKKTPMMLYLERHFNTPIEELIDQPIPLRKLAIKLATPNYRVRYETLRRWRQQLIPHKPMVKFVNQYS